MRLKRLELQGFKSFLDRTVLTFQPGITGVVGPNGCGKSNIVDAIQWVMGEQSAKHLRGDSMTDVIFNGSDSKAATSMAEVSLILDRQGVALAPQFAAFDKSDEIAITRRVYRDGTSEYCINKTQCRLRDIHELFMDTGVGKRAYSIIEQGQIDRMISVKPEERRGLFEEVAGITKYKAKRKEAEKKLEGTRLNLTRLQDIINELEKQIRSLKIQATRAKKYKELKEELETVDLYLMGRNAFRHSRAIETLTENKNQLVNDRSESDARYSQLEAEIVETDLKRIEQEKLVQGLGAQERDITLQIQKIESHLILLEEKKKNLQEAIERKKEEARLAQETLRDLESQRLAEEAHHEDITLALSSVQDSLKIADEKIKEWTDTKSINQRKRSEIEIKCQQNTKSKVTLESQGQNLGEKKNELQEAVSQLVLRKNDLLTQLDQQKNSLNQADLKIQETHDKVLRSEQEVTLLSSDCQKSSSDLSALEKDLYQSREAYHSQHSRLKSLEELQTNLEGYSSSARDLLNSLGEDKGSAIPLAEVISPEAQVEETIETLLGFDMNTILVKTTEEAENLTRIVNQKNLERVRLVALSELPQQSKSDGTVPSAFIPTAGFTPPGCTPLLDKVRVQEGYQAVAGYWFSKVYLANNVQELFELRKSYPDLTFVASEGQTVGHRDRSLSSGKAPSKMGVFARRREIESLASECKSLEEVLIQKTSEREGLLVQLQNQEKLHTELKDKLSVIHIEAVELRKEREKLQFEYSRFEREEQNLDRELALAEQNQSRVSDQITQLAIQLTDLAAESESLQSELTEVHAVCAKADQELELLVKASSEKRIEQSSLSERQRSSDEKLHRLELEISEEKNQVHRLQESAEIDNQEYQTKEQKSLETSEQMKGLRESWDKLLVELADVKGAFEETCTTLSEVRIQKENLQKERERLNSAIQELEINLAHEQSQLEQIKNISQERYHCEPQAIDESHSIDLEKLPLFKDGLNLEWALLLEAEKRNLLEEHLSNMREKIGRYGEVNLTAIQEFDDIQKRYDFLIEQKLDLENSIQILEDAIKKIEETTRVRFTETFEAVNKKFSEIFPILFNGGKAELTLVYQEGSTDPGVDIMAQPPGKRLQSITLLSGGEKALTAVSLVLAIFARKPSPFCLLDEVDAPLDDANVSRFNTVVKKMAEKTQFIVITHNKKTMEIAEALYGVTMQRNGISKMASVSLQ